MKTQFSQIQDEVKTVEFLKSIIDKYNYKNKITVTILGWQDGNWFEELCKENGGIKPNSLELFKGLPIAKKFTDINQFKDLIYAYCNERYLGSISGNYKFIFDIYVWHKKNLWIYNPYLEKMIYKELNYFEWLTGSSDEPPWIDHNLVLNEKNQKMKKPPYFSPMASGNKCIVLQENVNYDNFDEIADIWTKTLKMQVKDKTNGMSEKIWKGKIEGKEFYLSYDNWSPDISLEPINEEANELVLLIGKNMGIKND